jgi:hypothetical protein
VTRKKYPETHRYVFEMKLDIDSAVVFSAGELAAFVVDGLFALDRRAELFPGITNPENRLITVSLGAIGYRRWGRAAPVDKAYRRAMTTRWRPGREERTLKDDLETAREEIGELIMRQRMMMALMQGLENKCGYPTTLTDAEGVLGEALLDATQSIAQIVKAAAELVL